MADIQRGKVGPVPRHLQNVHADTYTMERQQGYLYPHDYPGNWVKQQYLPEGLTEEVFYEPSENGYEAQIRDYYRKIHDNPDEKHREENKK